MKIALPTEDGHLHEHFGGCRHFALMEVNAETKETLRTEMVSAPEHQPGLFPRWLRAQGVEVVIVGGVGRRALANFAQHGVSVRAGLAGESVEAQVTAFLEGRLVAGSMDATTERTFCAAGIQLVLGAPSYRIHAVVARFLLGQLEMARTGCLE